MLDLCELRPDLEALPAGIETEIGERGINLSGGQKQRISIARALYSRSDIYLIDDSLSALDAHVGKKIMKNVFAGELKNKTRVLVTHYLNLLEEPSPIGKVILVKEGRIVQNGFIREINNTAEWRDFSSSKEDG